MDVLRRKVTIYTDGSSSPNPGPSGWGAVLIFEDNRSMELEGFDLHSTNNRMELTAVLEALTACPDCSDVIIHTDSSNVVGWLSLRYRRIDREIDRLCLAIQTVVEAKDIHVDFVKVSGHTGDQYNERAHHLASSQAKKSKIVGG